MPWGGKILGQFFSIKELFDVRIAPFLLCLCSFVLLNAQVGINTTNPQQALHLDNSAGTIRIESLNHSNNQFNGGDVNNNSDLSDDFFPLYVDENGEFTLEFVPLENSEELDALNDATLPVTSIYVPSNDNNGYEQLPLQTYTITVSRPAVLEVKYNISYDIYYDPGMTVISDNLSRRIYSFVWKRGGTRTYGLASRSYTSGSTNSMTGTYYLFNRTYIVLPSAGTHTIDLYVGVSAAKKWWQVTGDITQSTYVEFAKGQDFIFFRLH